MVSSAAYPGLTGEAVPAVESPEIYQQELTYASGAHPVTISDDLQAGALSGSSNPAARALAAGLDLLLYAQSESGSATHTTRCSEGSAAAPWRNRRSSGQIAL